MYNMIQQQLKKYKGVPFDPRGPTLYSLQWFFSGYPGISNARNGLTNGIILFHMNTKTKRLFLGELD